MEADGIYKCLKNMNISSPDMRTLYLKYAQEYFENGNYLVSAYYQLEAQCFSYFNTISNDRITTKLEKYDFLVLENDIKKEHSNAILDFAKENNLNNGSEEYSVPVKTLHLEKEIKKMIHFNKTLPREWNVVHICKGYDPNTTISKKSKILTAKVPIFLTIIKHPRSAEFPDIIPIIQLNCNEVLQSFYEIDKNFKDIINFIQNGPRTKQQYVKDLKLFDNEIIESIQNLLNILGPWTCLFTGNINKNDKKIQQEYFSDVDIFCKKLKLSNLNKILLSMIVPYAKYLTDIDLKVSLENLNIDGNLQLSTTIYNFLIDQKNKTGYKYPLNPCVLIIDELLDHLPWEMANKTQEICRISSYNILKELFSKYKNDIIDGYLKIDVKHGHCIINPENNLPDMENRLKLFFNYWLSHWNCIYSSTPSKEKIEEIFSSEGVFIYCGHNSGMHKFDTYKIGIRNIKKSVIFLFGCSSVKLNSAGLHAELKGDHLYYHSSNCPVIVGLTNMGSDYPLDVSSTKILSTWIPCKDKTHWNKFNKLQWKKGKLIIGNNQENKIEEYEPRLASILSKIRADSSQNIRNIIVLVYRGLPVLNSCTQ